MNVSEKCRRGLARFSFVSVSFCSGETDPNAITVIQGKLKVPVQGGCLQSSAPFWPSCQQLHGGVVKDMGQGMWTIKHGVLMVLTT